ncbi:MAG: cytochrome C biogenesis protein, partial [Chthoniobacteraceae bacterium]
MTKWLPYFIAGILALWIVSAIAPKRDKEGTFAVQEFGRLPVISNGRFQPLDSLARNSLLQLREKQTASVEPWKGRKSQVLSASEWLQEMFFNQELANTRPVFRIDNPDVKGLLGLAMDADETKETDGKHFSWNQIKDKLQQLQMEVDRIRLLDRSQRTPFDQGISRLWTGVGLYMKLQNTVQPQNARDWNKELNAYLENVSAGVIAARAQQAGQTHDEEALTKLINDLSRFDTMQRLEPPLAVPPHHPERERDEWMRMGEALMEIARGETANYAVTGYAKMSSAFNSKQVADFNQAVSEYRTALSERFKPELKKASNEQRFNNFAPFYKALVLYVIAGVAVLAFWINPGRMEWFRRTA